MKVVIWIVVVLAILGGVYWYFAMQPAVPAAPATDNTNQSASAANTGADASATNTATTTSSAPMTATVMYTAQGFSPSSVTIGVGGTVTWVNQSGAKMWVASDPHPTHEGYDGTTRSQHCTAGYTGAAPFDECAAGDNYTFTFEKAGTWGYHNHANAGMDMGQVIVQ